MFIRIKYFFFFFSSSFFLFSFPAFSRHKGEEGPVCAEFYDSSLIPDYFCSDNSRPSYEILCKQGNFKCYIKFRCGDIYWMQNCKIPSHKHDEDDGDDKDDKDDKDDEDNDDDSQTCPNVKVKINAYPYKTGTVKLKCNNN